MNKITSVKDTCTYIYLLRRKDNQTRFGKGSEEKEDGVLCSSLSAFEFITHLIKSTHSQGQTGGGSRLTKLLCFFPSIIKCGKFPTWHLDKFIHMTYFISSITNLNIHIHTHLYIYIQLYDVLHHLHFNILYQKSGFHFGYYY